MKREPAWRIFAAEFNDATYEIKATEEKMPSYVVSPLGSKVNRVFITGVLTDVENVSENGEYIRAHISDPTGVFNIYSGQYQQEATTQLQAIEVPAFVALVGKIRTYVPEEGTMYVSVRPEIIREVDAKARDRWIIDTCLQTKHRISAVREAMKMKQPNTFDLHKLGYSKDLCEGVVAALQQYGTIDVSRYVTLIRESLQYIVPAREALDEVSKPEKFEAKTPKKKKKAEPKKTEEPAAESTDNKEEVENVVLGIIKKLEGDDGAAWDVIVEQCKKKKLSEDQIEEALTSLMDKGFIFEPVLGTIKTT